MRAVHTFTHSHTARHRTVRLPSIIKITSWLPAGDGDEEDLSQLSLHPQTRANSTGPTVKGMDKEKSRLKSSHLRDVMESLERVEVDKCRLASLRSNRAIAHRAPEELLGDKHRELIIGECSVSPSYTLDAEK